MNILFANIPFIKHDEKGDIYTGPNAGSRWPWTIPGITNYACFPFFMGYAVNYLRYHGIDAHFYDGVARKHWNYEIVKAEIAQYKPDVLFLETSTPLYRVIENFAIWAKEAFGSRVVLVGPHIQAYAHELIQKPFIDHCVIGEYEKPALDIVSKLERAEAIYTYNHVEDINFVKGENFLPFRPLNYLHNYLEPTMNTPLVQLQINTSRGCPFKCTYCQWPKVMNNGQYRNRLPELVIEEIKSVIKAYKDFQEVAAFYKTWPEFFDYTIQHLKWIVRGIEPGIEGIMNIMRGTDSPEVKSILFDDDTWNLGSDRIKKLCAGLKDISLPWTMMGRIDTSSLELYDLMVDSGCVGMRFGVESFNQRLVDNVKKSLSTRRSYENIKYLITRFSNMEFHFTTMKNLPGETDEDWQKDLEILKELKALGEKSNNIIHWQNSDCVAFPGTELWEEMVDLGKGKELKNFELYDGSLHNDKKLAEAVGWLGKDYKPKWSRYSKMGEPTSLPES